MKSKNKILLDLKQKIEDDILLEIKEMSKKNELRDAIEYSLLNGGKRFRPIIVLLIAQCIGKNFDATKAAISCEFFHTASLIADDLPCMDDEKLRRCKPTLHLRFSEAIAVLASYSLISAGYELIYKNSQSLLSKLPQEKCDRICTIAIEAVSKYAGVNGATGGQYLDLYSRDDSIEAITEIIHKKTISLFEIAFILGWLFGGGELEKLDLVKKASFHFGMAFQVADDLKDFDEDLKNNKTINIAIALGKETAKNKFLSEIKNLKDTLNQLDLNKDPFKLIVDKLEKLV